MTHTSYAQLREHLPKNPRTWLVTGVAGFIGSHLLEQLLLLDQRVIGIDNLSTGKAQNLEEVRALVAGNQWDRFTFLEGDLRSQETCGRACQGVDYVLHHAALGSVPRSILDPIATTEHNINGTLNMLVAARDAGVRRVVFASSSSVYGDNPILPKREENVGNLLSPYAVSKHVNELHAAQFSLHYGLATVGLRYFNVFGPRQDPNGAYSAVIPRWIAAMIRGETVTINGNGETSRDFCYVANVVQANLLAATKDARIDGIYNVAVSDRTSLNDLFEMIRSLLVPHHSHLQAFSAVHGPLRKGDIAHSHADITRAREGFGYSPTHRIQEGLAESMKWYRQFV